MQTIVETQIKRDPNRLETTEQRRLERELVALEQRAIEGGRAVDQMLLAMTRACLSAGRRPRRA